MADEHKGPCGVYCAVVDECAARGAEIERLTRERDEARRKVVRLQEALVEALEWIDADDGCATDFPEEWERLKKLIGISPAETKKK